MLRGAAARITTPLLPDDYLQLANPLWTARELRGRILQVRKETADSVTLVIKPGWGFDFDYRAGQFIGIGILVDGRWHWRSYSLTSPPERNSTRSTLIDRRAPISIAVKAMPEGFLSSHLVGGVPAGTIVRLASPAGDFRLPEPPPPRVLFLTAGSGITPVIAMLRTMDRRREFTDVVHVHSAPTQQDVMFGDELRQLAARHPVDPSDGAQADRPGSFRYRVQLTREHGKFALSELDELYPDWRDRQTWACGPAGMLDEIERVWADAGVADRLHLERFEIERAAVGQGGTVSFRRSGRTVAADGATTLLQAGEGIGVAMPFGCRMGICRTCVVPLSDGAVTDLRTGAQYQAGEKIQTCVCAAAGDCTLDC